MEFVIGVLVGLFLAYIAKAPDEPRSNYDRKEPTMYRDPNAPPPVVTDTTPVVEKQQDANKNINRILAGAAVGYGLYRFGKSKRKTSYSKAGNSIKPKYPSRRDKNKPLW